MSSRKYPLKVADTRLIGLRNAARNRSFLCFTASNLFRIEQSHPWQFSTQRRSSALRFRALAFHAFERPGRRDVEQTFVGSDGGRSVLQLQINDPW